MTQPTTNSIHRAWLRRRRGRVVVVGVVMCAVRVGGFARAREPGTPPAAARRALCWRQAKGRNPADKIEYLLKELTYLYSSYERYYKGFFFLNTFMKKKVATKSRQTTSSISHVQHLLPRMLATWLG